MYNWNDLIRQVNQGVLIQWIIANAVPNHFTYLVAIIGSPFREPAMLYSALNLMFSAATPPEILAEVASILSSNGFDTTQVEVLNNG